jgi:hypothetical protein
LQIRQSIRQLSRVSEKSRHNPAAVGRRDKQQLHLPARRKRSSPIKYLQMVSK